MTAVTVLRALKPAFVFRALPFLAIGAAVVSSGSAMAAPKVGVAAAVNTEAYGTPPGGARRTMVLGENVIYQHRIETGGTGLVQVLLVDGSTFTVGANSDLVIDEFVYDPDAGSGKLVASFGKGVARFVGGRLSKKKGGVTVKTPVGTIGIRGGIANLNLAAGEGAAFSLLFGDELSFTGTDGSTNRVYESGYTLQVDFNGSAGRVRQTTQADLGGVQQGLSSRPGQNGGTGNPPADRNVRQSRVPDQNSGLGPVSTLPPPKPQVVRSTRFGQADNDLVEVQKNNQDRTRDEINRSNVEIIPVRILTGGSNFSPSFDNSRVVAMPGAQGIIGSTAGTDETVNFNFGDVISGTSSYVVRAQAAGTTIYQYIYPNTPGSFYYSHTLTSDGDFNFQEGRSTFVPDPDIEIDTETYGDISGFARGVQVSGQNFVAFAHFPAISFVEDVPSYRSDAGNVILGLYGVGTNFSNFGGSVSERQLRTYSLYADPVVAFSMGSELAGGGITPLDTDALFINPLIAQTFGASFMESVVSTDFKLIESSKDTLNNANGLAGSFLIDGTGAAQKSFVSLAVGGVYQNSSGKLVFGTGRRGGHRVASSDYAAAYYGGVDTLPNSVGDTFFGTNAQSFVLGFADLANDDVSNDRYVERPSGVTSSSSLSSSFHVGTLSSSSAVSGLTRTNSDMSGFAAGVIESTANSSSGTEAGPIPFASTQPQDVVLRFDASQDTMGASLTVADSFQRDADVASYTVAFGVAANGAGSARGTYLDNDTYAAIQAADAVANKLVTDSATELSHNSANTGANNYLLPSTLMDGADSAIFASGVKCTCAFLEWGYWGTSLEFHGTEAQSALTSNERYDQVHLGTWVAGNVTQSNALPAMGSASYDGHAVGNVISGGNQYLAAGDFNMTVDFGTRTANAQISNFDGKSFSFTGMSEVSSAAEKNLFSQTLSGGTTDQSKLNASLVAGSTTNHDGAIGNFSLKDGASWTATGIVAGEKTSGGL